MEPAQDARLSELLDRQQAGSLSENERSELQTLMQIYQAGLLRKATALSEAVRNFNSSRDRRCRWIEYS